MENRSQRDKTWKGSRASVLSGTNSPISGIFSTKKVFILDSPRTGDKRSDIPNLEADYCPRDETGRRLFWGVGESCECNCPFHSSRECLKRNRLCALKCCVILLSTLVVIFLLACLTYSLHWTTKGGDSEHRRTHTPVHYHTGSVVPGETSNKREYVDEGSTETDLNIFFYKTQKDDNLLSHYEIVELNDDEKLAKVQPSFIRSLDTSNEYLREDISTISSKKRIARRSVRSMNSYETEDIADILTKQDKWTKLEGNNLDVDKEAFKANAKTVFESFSLTVPSAFNTYESYSQETNELDDASKKTSTININEEESEEATETLEMKKGIIRNVTSEEHIDKKDVKYMSDIEVLQEVEIQKSYFTTSNSNDFIPVESVTEVQITDSQVTERTSNTYGGYATPTTWSESPRMAEQNPPVDTISLAEAIKRRNDKRKYLFLNSRVVGGSSDVRLPTASDVTKPPVSAFESLKTGQQLSFSPSGSSPYLFPYQMCLFANPYVGSKPSIRSTQSRTFPLGVPSLFSLDKADPLKQFARTPTQQNFLTFSVNNYASPPARQQFHYPSTGPGLSNFPPQQMLLHNAPMPSTQPIFCTYLQPPLFQFPTMPGTADFAHGKSFNFEEDVYQKPPVENVLHSGGMIHCSDDNVACRDGSNCIPIRNWCDNQVHCQDISDEAFCSCRERVARDRICDGYLDCPRGEDELGCFGCPKSAFSCDSVISPGSCIALNKRCDGVRDCAIGNDENDCSALFPHIQTNNSYQVSHASGYLHRNWKGDWFPVCVDVSYDQWAKEACLGEIGYLPSVVEVNFAAVPDYYKGPFIVRNDDGTTSMQDHCKGHVSTYVKCPPIKCGTRAEFYNLHDIETRFKRFNELDLLNSANYKADENATDVNHRFTILNASEIEGNSKTKREETGRVVGGRESEPRAWPWAIAIYKDGGFLCGGVILDDHWVLTAAHCMQQYWKHYYEVRGGMLRRFSFSPMEQVRVVADVIVHENYDPVIMNNDIALLRLQKPFEFNRWVRPGCLPSFRGHISNFFSTPLPGTHCIAVGWGALRERGIDADQLREVEVPIMLRCKHKEDLAGAEICAGTAEGGKDTCQGDSGGPLLCKNSQAPLAWYVAGVVSHGEGCARPGEPGAYTRISLFVDWITVNANDFRLLTIKPLATCPGFRCTSGTRLCIPAKWVCNGFTDCLEAEDEKNCTGNFPYEQYYPQLSSASFPKSLNMRIASSSSTINTSGHRPYKTGTESTGKEEKQFLGKDIRPETDIPDAKYFYDTKVKGFEFREDDRISLMELNDNSKKSSTTNLDGPPPIRSAVYLNDPSVPDVYPFDIQMLHRRRQYKTLQDAQKFYNIHEGTAPTAKLSVAKVRETSQHSQWEEANPTIYPVQIGSFSSADYPMEEIEQDLKSQTMPNATLEPYFFQCHEITQSIPMEYHCDGMRDCEDGSDETNCLCSDVLKRSKAELLCDGSHDCPDGSDEANCERCTKNEFLCKISGECLPMSEKCNGVPKCRFGEDERNCFALSRTEKIVLNAGDDPPLEQKGFVLQYKNGYWSRFCQEKRQILAGKVAADVCLDLGWIGYDVYENVTLTYGCTGLYVTCSPGLATSLHHYQVLGGGYLWPWNAFVYSDGTLICSAVLLRAEWLLTSSMCIQNISLSENYLVAKMGSKTPESTGAGHQVVRIDAVQLTPGTDLVLLHLSNTINQTLSVRPLLLPYVFTSDPERDICVAVGDGTVFLKFVDNCSESTVCYDRMASKPVNCKSQGWIGLIACQSRLGWYPSSPFSEDNGSCGFISKEFSSVQDKLKLIYLQLDKNIQKVPQPLCEGFRCPQGLCISYDKVCDGSVDCPSKADEDIAKCAQLQKNAGCHQTELKCKNGRCVSKNVFGDEIDDCGDGSDEPEERTCLEYLRLTAPQKICNGIRNCYDKSDEDPNLCACDEDKFKCRISNYCLPKDFVCDGERDCPGGEDEEKCFGRRNLYHLNNEAFEIVKNSYGLWHSMCPMTVTTETSDALCRELGFERASLIYETNQTVLTPQLDPFTWIKLNGLTRVALRSDRPIARLVRATKSCYVVKCV